MEKLKTILLIFCLLLIPFVSLSSSQPTERKFSPGMGVWHWRELNRCWGASDLHLNPNQGKALDSINQTYLRETRLLRAEIFSKRLELREFFTNPTIKIEGIRAKHIEILEHQFKLEEKTIEYLIKVRNLLTQEQLKMWCPEQEFFFSWRMMHEPDFMGPMNPKRNLPPPERFQKE
jgi:Spy/CpxP family protein refolding chaperone